MRFFTNHLKEAVLLFILGAFSAHATSVIPAYPAAHYGNSDWRVTQINGVLISAQNAPKLLFRDGVVSVEWGCRFFWFDEKTPNKQSIEYSLKPEDCQPITEQEQQVLRIFRNFYGFTPWGQDSMRVMSTDADILAAKKVK